VLIPWAAETLESAWYELGYDLGFWPEPPIRVEIYPRSETLARVSSLSEEAVATSGTIALCKYNKLMFTSPRATVRGYGWRDTLSHEYVHYVVAHLTRRDLPIWLHEALAKYLERRWTGERTMRMTPSREGLLTRRIESNTLVTFQQMHPSMAYLPSAEDASVAYAQVFTIMEYVVQRRGTAAIRSLLYRLRDGEELEDAFASTFGERFDVFERSWMRYLRSRPRVHVPGDFHEEIRLRGAIREEAPDEEGADVDGLRAVEGNDLLRLGELLRARGHVEAALVQYERARHEIPEGHPALSHAMARVLLDLESYDEALAAVTDAMRWHPEIYRAHLLAGEALARLERWDEARRPLEEALGINPFDPDVHR
jgi:tetratricopeptide (TPR) repeat protein